MANEEHLTRLKQGFVNVLATMRYAFASGAACVYVGVRTWRAEQQVGEGIRQTGQQVMARLRSTPWQDLARRYQWLLVVLGALMLLLAIWKLPQWYAASWENLTTQDLAKLESDARSTMVQAVGGLALLAGLLFTWRNLRMTEQNSRQTLDLSRKGQINDRFIKAIEQLGAVDQGGGKKLEVRLGGIYALEQITKDSPDDHHWPIMEILTAYVREHAPWKEEEQPKPATDIQAILTVVGRRTRIYGKEEDQRLDLARTALQRASLAEAHLEGAQLAEAHLEGADLRGAHLERADLVGAHLERAILWGAHLERADLAEADLEWAELGGATLERADLSGATLEDANLAPEQLATVRTLYQAHLDAPLREQIEQRYPHLLKDPEDC